MSDTKNQLNSEILRRVDLENQVQTHKEQLDLQRNVSEQVTQLICSPQPTSNSNS